jgi:DNA-binding transcriptional LysR family regulator
MVLKGAADVGLLHAPLINGKGLGYKSFSTEEFLLVVPHDDKLNALATTDPETGKIYLDIRLTEGHDYILPNSARGSRNVAEGILRRAGFNVNEKYTVSDMPTAIQMVQAGMGLTMVPRNSKKCFESRSPGYYEINPVYEPVWYPCVCYPTEMSLSRPAQEFMRICDEILPDFYAKQAI